jgi:hypothetical protein
MDEYYIVPKRMMENRASQIQLNKEPPEAVEVLSLDNLTSKILRRGDISDWEKASMLTSTLERFLALKPKAFNEPINGPASPTEASDTGEPKLKKIRKSRVGSRRRRDRTEESFHTPAAVSPAAPNQTRSGKSYQVGKGKRKWIFI